MVKKEDLGGVLKKIARVIPGIGSYQDKESVRESDKELRLRLGKRLAEQLGLVEWLKTDQAKKGAFKHLTALEDLTRHLEKVSRMIENASRGYAPLFSDRRVDEDALNRLFEYDKSLCDGLSEMDRTIKAMTAERALPDSEEIRNVRRQLNHMEKAVKDRESLLKELG